MADFIHDGDAIDYTPSSAVTGGDVVVLGTLVGVAKKDIAANALGALHVKGVFAFPKDASSGGAIAVGVDLYWDATNEIMTETSAGNTLAGKSVLAAAAADTTVRVRLNQ